MNPRAKTTSEDAPDRTVHRALASLPAVHRALQELGPAQGDLPQPLVTDLVRRHLAQLRATAETMGVLPPPREQVMADLRRALAAVRGERLRPVINATGILIHTNLGRSPLSAAAIAAVVDAASGYTNLEYDLEAGKRGSSRGGYVERALAICCGAQAATVVNNCAAALVLILRHFTQRPPRTHVVISRGQLVQIGGGFRVPEILEAAGATIREVGTTNRTTIEDYRKAIDERTALILQVHPSNFYTGGFVESPARVELAALARSSGVPLVEDIGSGATFDTRSLNGGEEEPTPTAVLAAGVDAVCFSGDKLLGGPQAGIIAGRSDLVAALKREPFFRALRCDKLVLAALGATVDAILADDVGSIPNRRMMETTPEALRVRAQRIRAVLSEAAIEVQIGTGESQVGGGSLPRTSLPSVTLNCHAADLQALVRRLRLGDPPVIGYVADGTVRFDLRTVFPEQDESLTTALRAAATGMPDYPGPVVVQASSLQSLGPEQAGSLHHNNSPGISGTPGAANP